MSPADRIEELELKFSQNAKRYFAPLANEYRKAGQLDRAIDLCRTFLEQQPGHINGNIVLGQALFQSGRYDEAMVVHQTAVSLDPENLIALRQLGEIAQLRSDTTAALVWFQRLLDADPRNEEVAAVIRELKASPATDAAGPFPDETPDAVEVAAPAPTPDPVAIDEPPAKVENVRAGSILDEPPADPPADQRDDPSAWSFPPARESVGAQIADEVWETLPRSERDEPEAEADDWLSTTPSADATGTTAEPTDPAPEPPSALGAAAEIDVEDDAVEDFFLDAELESFALPAPTERARPTPSWEQIGIDPVREHFEAEASETTPQVAEGAIYGSTEDVFVEGATGEYMGGSPTDVEEQAPKASPEPAWPELVQPEPVQPEAAPEPVVAEAIYDVELRPHQGDAPTPAFVTETMAELYLGQGYVEEATTVYRELLARNPTDERVARRLRELEEVRERDAIEAEAARRTPARAPVVADPRDRVSVREFVRGFALRGALEGNGGAQRTTLSTISDESLADAREGGPDSLDALFGASGIDIADDDAARRLAGAFTPAYTSGGDIGSSQVDDAAIAQSARTPHAGVARSATPAAPFSFERFFATEDSTEQPAASEERGAGEKPGGGDGDDISQFNAWLEGLRKR